MKPYQITILASPMGHDVDRMARITRQWLSEVPQFSVRLVGSPREAACSIPRFFDNRELVDSTDLFLMICPHDEFSASSRACLEQAVKNGKAIFFHHGPQPAYRDWPEAEKMIGLLWREGASHGDFGPCSVRIDCEHPITAGVADFETQEELYCGLSNVHNVPLEVLVSGYSRADLRSRHGKAGTGCWEPLVTLGHYGQGRCVNFLLGHVWPYYTGHGLQEHTMIAFEPPQVKTLLLRSVEYALCGKVEATLGL